MNTWLARAKLFLTRNLVRLVRRIEKPKEGEYPPYAIMYIGLLPDDGLVLKAFER
jgi:hypothetical protein